MDLPFSLRFRQFGKIIPVLTFFSSEREVEWLAEEQMVTITENLDLEISFTSQQPSAKFYMEGLEVVSLREIQSDDAGSFLTPSPSYVTMFDSKKAESYSPFIPGIYLIKVVCGEQRFYTAIQIQTKQMTHTEWNYMKQDIERCLPGFTYDEERRSMLKQRFKESVTVEELQKWYQLIQGVIQNPHRTMSRTPPLRKVNSVRQNQRQGKRLEYNTIENQWLKMILRRIVALLNRQVEKGGDVKEVVKFRNFLQQMLQGSWLATIEVKSMKMMPPSSLFDKRYLMIYELYRLLQIEKNHKYYISKRTDLLYETWCYLQIIEALLSEKVGFQLEGGFENPYPYFIQAMKEKKVVEFKKQGITVKVSYDDMVPCHAEGTNENCPIFTSSVHNRPDTRLDIWKDDCYCGTIVIDYKYRPLKHIWDYSLLLLRKPNRVMTQLDSYKSQMRSQLVGRGESQYKRVNPIVEVWAIYPRGNSEEWSNHSFQDYGIQLLRLNPLESKDLLCDHLNRSIYEAIEPFLHEKYSK